MTALTRIEANRQNARMSTGPRTLEGKAVSSQNAATHGLLSREAVLPGEDRDAFESLRKGLFTNLAPVGHLEVVLVERIALSAWRLNRLTRVETSVFLEALTANEEDDARQKAKDYVLDELAEFGNALGKTVTNAMAHEQARDAAEQAKARRRGSPMALSRAFSRDGREAGLDTFGKLTRYEAGIERSLYRAVHHLQRIQGTRRGEPVPPSVQIEVSNEEP